MEEWEEMLLIIQHPEKGTTEREIAKLEAEGWKLVHKGKAIFEIEGGTFTHSLYKFKRRKTQQSD